MAGRGVIVTGGGGGLGRALCAVFAEAGDRVAVIGRSEARAADALDIVEARTGRRIFVQADFERPETAERAVSEAAEALGGLDVLMNNAALALRRGLDEASAEDWARMCAVNVAAPYFAARAAARAMAEGGVIVNVASEMGRLANPDSMLYATTKAALIHLNGCLAARLAPRVRVIALAPGPFRTPMLEASIAQSGAGLEEGLARHAARVPLGRLAEAEEVARVALRLASPDAAFMTGAVVALDGGTTLART